MDNNGNDRFPSQKSIDNQLKHQCGTFPAAAVRLKRNIWQNERDEADFNHEFR